MALVPTKRQIAIADAPLTFTDNEWQTSGRGDKMMWFIAERYESPLGDQRNLLVKIVLECMESLPSYGGDPYEAEMRDVLKAIRLYVGGINPLRSVRVAMASASMFRLDVLQREEQPLCVGYYAANIIRSLRGILWSDYPESDAYFAVNDIAQALSYRALADANCESANAVMATVRDVREKSLQASAAVVRKWVPDPPPPRVVYHLANKENRWFWSLWWLKDWRWWLQRGPWRGFTRLIEEAR
jgi:hypothetical protein